jgi:hypothetical protein
MTKVALLCFIGLVLMVLGSLTPAGSLHGWLLFSGSFGAFIVAVLGIVRL